MQTNNIQIDDLIIQISNGKAFKFPSKFLQRELSGINLNFRINNNKQTKIVEEIFQRDQVKVIDPFVGETYQAQVSIKTISSQSGVPGQSYIVEVKEVDLPPNVKQIELNGIVFEATDYKEDIDADENISREAVLKLSNHEFYLLHEAAKNETVSVIRLGIDNEPIELKLRAYWWSEHEEGGAIYFKQMIQLNVPQEDTAKSKPNMFKSFTMLLLNQQKAIIDTQGRYEALINLLIEKQILTTPEGDNLMKEELEKLIDGERLTQIKREMLRVQDAEL